MTFFLKSILNGHGAIFFLSSSASEFVGSGAMQSIKIIEKRMKFFIFVRTNFSVKKFLIFFQETLFNEATKTE